MSQNRLSIPLGAFVIALLLSRGPAASGSPDPAPASPDPAPASPDPAPASPDPAPALAEEDADDPAPPPAKTAKKKKKQAEVPPTAEPTGEPGPATEGPEAEGKTAEKKPAAKKPDGEGETTTPTAKLKKKPSVDEKYVLDNLQAHLSPTKLDVLPDGRVKMIFEFGKQLPEIEAAFTPKISKEVNNVFRWSLRGEYSGYYGVSARAEDGMYYYGALRVSQQGAAHLNAWFTDDVEAEIVFAQGSNSSAQQVISVVLTGSQSRKSIGSNWGTQCATFQAGRLKGAKGTVETINMDTATKIKLVARNGIFEAHRDGRQKQTFEYNPKDFTSSQIGLIWGGRLAGFIYKMEVTGRLDAKKMAEMMKKTRK